MDHTALMVDVYLLLCQSQGMRSEIHFMMSTNLKLFFIRTCLPFRHLIREHEKLEQTHATIKKNRQTNVEFEFEVLSEKLNGTAPYSIFVDIIELRKFNEKTKENKRTKKIRNEARTSPSFIIYPNFYTMFE